MASQAITSIRQVHGENASCRLASRSNDPDSLTSKMKLTVSVIIPTKNRPADLAAMLPSLFRQTVIPDQLIIVDQSASDESERQVRSLYEEASPEIRNGLGLHYFHEPNVSGGATARNRGLEIVNADVTLFLDDDVMLEPDFIERLLDVYSSHPDAAGVSGIVTNAPAEHRLSRWWWNKIFMRGVLRDDRQPVYWNVARLGSTSPIRVSRFTGMMMSFRTEVIRDHRFDENLQGVSDGEDVDFSVRLGPEAVLLINPSARLVHNASPMGRETGHWLRREARSVYYLYHKNWNSGLFNRLSFAWLNVGYFFIATLGSVRRLSFAPWRALLGGRRDAREIQRRASARRASRT